MLDQASQQESAETKSREFMAIGSEEMASTSVCLLVALIRKESK